MQWVHEEQKWNWEKMRSEKRGRARA